MRSAACIALALVFTAPAAAQPLPPGSARAGVAEACATISDLLEAGRLEDADRVLAATEGWAAQVPGYDRLLVGLTLSPFESDSAYALVLWGAEAGPRWAPGRALVFSPYVGAGRYDASPRADGLPDPAAAPAFTYGLQIGFPFSPSGSGLLRATGGPSLGVRVGQVRSRLGANVEPRFSGPATVFALSVRYATTPVVRDL